MRPRPVPGPKVYAAGVPTHGPSRGTDEQEGSVTPHPAESAGSAADTAVRRPSARRNSRARRLAETVYEEVKDAIIRGHLSSGEKLSVDHLCSQFGVSRQPVMEAMRRLSGDWFVEIIPQVGCRVCDYTYDDCRDWIATFGATEANIAALAAARRTESDLEDLERVWSTLHSSDVYDISARLAARDLHDVLLQMSHSQALARLSATMWDFGEFAMRIVIGTEIPTTILRGWEDSQRGLVEAIKAQNAEAAYEHMFSWMTNVGPE